MWSLLWLPNMRLYKITGPDGALYEVPGVLLHQWLTKRFGYLSPGYSTFTFKARVARLTDAAEKFQIHGQ